jgi:hypothetical protein
MQFAVGVRTGSSKAGTSDVPDRFMNTPPPPTLSSLCYYSYVCTLSIAAVLRRFSGPKRGFCAITLKCIILPRQARDKHREDSKEWFWVERTVDLLADGLRCRQPDQRSEGWVKINGFRKNGSDLADARLHPPTVQRVSRYICMCRHAKPLFFEFPYVYPEPVLVKRAF